MTRTLADILVAGLVCAVAAAQPLEVPRTDVPPTLDGALDDACWQTAAIVSDFTAPGTDEAPLEPTEARLCHDGVWLYIGFLCHESAPEQIVREQAEHDGSVNLDDSVEVFIVPTPDRSRYYHFLLSVNNIRAEQQGWPGRTPYRNWDVGWRSATVVTDDGWVAEIALPLSMMQGGGEQWYFNLCRNKRTEPAQWTCVAPVQRLFNELEQFPAMAQIPAEGAAFAPILTDPRVSGYHEGEGGWGYQLTVHAENMTGQPGALELRVSDQPLRGQSAELAVALEMGPKDEREVAIFMPAAQPSERSVTLRLVDPESGELRQWLMVRDTTPLSPLSAWLDRSFYSTERVARALCEVRAPEAALAGWALSVQDADGRALAGATELAPGEQAVELPLEGFAPGEHALAVVLSDAGGGQVAREELVLARREPRPNEVKIDRVRAVALVDGEPFFPMGMLAVDVEDVPGQAAAGFNTVSSFAIAYDWDEHRPTDIADAAQAHGMKLVEYLPRYFRTEEGVRPRHAGISRSDPQFAEVVKATVERDLPPVIEALRDHPALIAYYGIDEPSGEYPRIASQHLYDGAHAMDPHHPLLVLFSSWTPDEPGWHSTMDLVGVDPYMQMGHQERTDFRRGIVYMAIATRRAKRFADEMHSTVWIVPQAEYYSGSVRPLLPREQTCQTWVALIYGARGLLWFRNPVYHRANWENFSDVTRRVRALMPALLTLQPEQEIAYEPIEARAFDYPLVHACVLAEPDGTPVILAANTEPNEAAVRFDVEGLGGGVTVSRMFADARPPVRDGGFEDAIEPYGVRAYRLGGHELADETRLTVTIGGEALAKLEEPRVSSMPPPERNMLPGGGALESADGWTVNPGGGAGNAPATVEFVEREDGEGRCLRITRDNDFSNACIISDWLTLEPNTRYRYGCEMRGTITLGTGRISMMMIGEDGHGVPEVPSLTLQSSQEQWQALERTVATGDEPVKLRVWLSLYRVGGEGWWDNAFLEELGPAAPTRNLLANSSFEHAVLEGWPDMWWPPDRVSPRIGEPGAQWTQDFDEAWHGECSLRTTKSDPERVVRPYFTTRQGPEARSGESYVFSIYMKADESGRRVTLRVGDGFETFPLTTDWQRYHVTGTFTVAPTGPREHVWVAYYCQDEGTYWADAAQVEPGEEPTEWVPDQFPGAREW